MNTVALPPSSAAFLALAALDRYQADLDRLVHGRPQPHDWERIAADLRELRRLFGALPALCVPWLGVLMSGMDLLSMVAQQRGPERLQQKMKVHAAHLARLEHCCREGCAHAH